MDIVAIAVAVIAHTVDLNFFSAPSVSVVKQESLTAETQRTQRKRRETPDLSSIALISLTRSKPQQQEPL